MAKNTRAIPIVHPYEFSRRYFHKVFILQGPALTLVREQVSFFDNNMFVTNWVLQVLHIDDI